MFLLSGEKKTPKYYKKASKKLLVFLVSLQQAKFFKNGANNAVDDGGHMIGSRFKGIVEQINYFPQELNTNRSGDWKSVEDEWERIAKGRPAVIRNGVTTPAIPPQTVRVDIRPQFTGTSRRPDGFNVTETIGTNAPNPRPYISNL